jgi:hypothetical protein
MAAPFGVIYRGVLAASSALRLIRLGRHCHAPACMREPWQADDDAQQVAHMITTSDHDELSMRRFAMWWCLVPRADMLFTKADDRDLIGRREIRDHRQ